MPKFEIIIPTRDSARWIGIFLDAYRKAGIEPLYIVDTRTTDSTQEILLAKGANMLLFTPHGDFVEAGMIEFGARHASTKWILRVDDDEFPSRALLRWIASVGVKSLNQMWYISIRTLFVCDGAIHYSRSLGHFAHPQAAAFLHPHPRLFHADRVVYRQKVHTPGFEAPAYASFAPQDAFLVHCNCLLRTPSERWSKIQKYAAIDAQSTLRLADEYLPELFALEHHDARRDGLDEFADLFEKLPIQWSAAPADLDSQTRDLLNREVADFHDRISASRSPLAMTSADNLAWLLYIPRWFWKPLAVSLQSVGRMLQKVGAEVRDYQTYFAPVEVGELICFSDRVWVAKLMKGGWSGAEATGVWSEGECSEIALPLARSLESFLLEFDLRPFADHGNSQEITVVVNGRECDHWLFDNGERRTVVVGVRLSEPADTVAIKLLNHRPVSPHEFGESGDKRKLAIFLHSLNIDIQN